MNETFQPKRVIARNPKNDFTKSIDNPFVNIKEVFHFVKREKDFEDVL